MCRFIDDLQQRLVDNLTGSLGVSREAAGLVAASLVGEIYRDWRGERPYIGPPGELRDRISERNRDLLRDWRAGERIPLLARRYGISVQRVYAVLKLSRSAS